MTNTSGMDDLVVDGLNRMIERASVTKATVGDRFPHWADSSTGVWTTTADGDWTGGAWPGQLWLAATVTGDQHWQNDARHWLALLGPRLELETAFKGFTFYHAAALGSLLHADPNAREAGLRCAQHLASMFDERLGLIPLGPAAEEHNSVGAAESSIDSLQASPLLLWAARELDDSELERVAVAHTTRVLEIHVRENGSVIQSSTLDPTDGSVVRYHTHKGYDDSSTWARAQAWAVLYAAQCSAIVPGQPQWRRTARVVADWWISHVPADGVSYWDFDDPAVPDTERDTAATAIVVSGLLKLAAVEPDGGAYKDHAVATVATLVRDHLTDRRTDSGRPGGMLIHGCFTKRASRPQDAATDVELIFGDYFLMESLAILAGHLTPADLDPDSVTTTLGTS